MIRVLINKFTFMKDSKQSFKDLVKKMDSLEQHFAKKYYNQLKISKISV